MTRPQRLWSGQAVANVIIFNLCLVAVCGYALVRGGAPERIVAALLLLAAGATYVAQAQDSLVFHDVEFDILLIDLALLAGLVLVALHADRFWPLWMIGFHGVTVMVHAAKAFQPDLVPLMYGMAVGKLAYPVLAILAIGTWRHRTRARRFGADRSWSGFSTSSRPVMPMRGQTG